MKALQRTRRKMRRMMLNILCFKAYFDTHMQRYNGLNDDIDKRISQLYVKVHSGAFRMDGGADGRRAPSVVDAYRSDQVYRVGSKYPSRTISEVLVRGYCGEAFRRGPSDYIRGSLLREDERIKYSLGVFNRNNWPSQWPHSGGRVVSKVTK